MLCLSVAALLRPAPSSAAGSYYAIGGSEWDTEGQSFSYIGGGATRPLDESWSVVGKVFAGYLDYKFESNGQTLDAEVPILTPAAGLQFHRGPYTLGGSLGLDLRKAKKEQPGGGSQTSSDAGLSVQGEAYVDLSERKSLEAIVSYSTIENFFWARGRVKKPVYEFGGGVIKAGVEAVGMGNEDFSAFQAGVLAEILKASGFSVLVKTGYKHSSALNAAGYGGIELYYGF